MIFDNEQWRATPPEVVVAKGKHALSDVTQALDAWRQETSALIHARLEALDSVLAPKLQAAREAAIAIMDALRAGEERIAKLNSRVRAAEEEARRHGVRV